MATLLRVVFGICDFLRFYDVLPFSFIQIEVQFGPTSQSYMYESNPILIGNCTIETRKRGTSQRDTDVKAKNKNTGARCDGAVSKEANAIPEAFGIILYLGYEKR